MNTDPETAVRAKWVRLLCFAPLLASGTVAFVLGSFPFPEDNDPPQKILHYTLSHRTVEIQSLIYLLLLSVMMVIFAMLAMAYREREKKTTLWPLLLVVAGSSSVIVQFLSLGIYLVIPAFYRGFPDAASASALAPYTWDLANVIFTTSFVFTGLAWGAIFMANRTCPILPSALGRYGAGALVVVCFGGQSTLFFATGPWSPVSFLATIFTGTFPPLIWIFLLGLVPPRRWIPSFGSSAATENREPTRVHT